MQIQGRAGNVFYMWRAMRRNERIDLRILEMEIVFLVLGAALLIAGIVGMNWKRKK